MYATISSYHNFKLWSTAAITLVI